MDFLKEVEMLWNNLTLDFCKVTVDYLVCMPMKEDSRGACNYCQSRKAAAALLTFSGERKAKRKRKYRILQSLELESAAASWLPPSKRRSEEKGGMPRKLQSSALSSASGAVGFPSK